MSTLVGEPVSAADSALETMYWAQRAARQETEAVTRVRDAAFARYRAQGIPNRRVEAWKYTDLRAALSTPFPIAPVATRNELLAAREQAELFRDVDAFPVRIVNGCADPFSLLGRESLKGVEILPLSKALQQGRVALDGGSVVAAANDVLMALNTAFLSDGVFIRIAPSVVVSGPIHLSVVNLGLGPVMSFPRVILEVGSGARLTLLESIEGPATGSCQTNSVLEIRAGEDAEVTHLRLANGTGNVVMMSTLAVRLAARARIKTVNLESGAVFARRQIYVELGGEGASAFISGSAMIEGREHADTSVRVDHLAPGCDSRELFKTAVAGEGVGVFQGMVAVHRAGQKTDARMTSAALLLSARASMNNKPELEIYADDVVCSHGATCGQLDDDLLFYLTSRGISRRRSEALIVRAFLAGPTEDIEDTKLRAAFQRHVDAWLANRVRTP